MKNKRGRFSILIAPFLGAKNFHSVQILSRHVYVSDPNGVGTAPEVCNLKKVANFHTRKLIHLLQTAKKYTHVSMGPPALFCTYPRRLKGQVKLDGKIWDYNTGYDDGYITLIHGKEWRTFGDPSKEAECGI
ncbi:hypothetical protein ACFOPX_06665 [Helicobacter baculiformis]|uniref:Uncharacterized protein n=1 Tax=Helicobacter baculiformis TaxID=427351 RepID=A0ABV7ZI03_9HELI|nr:hypothetical protein [Helicobacter baculiformis]